MFCILYLWILRWYENGEPIWMQLKRIMLETGIMDGESDYGLDSQIYDKLLRNIPSTSKILEIGCGRGHFSNYCYNSKMYIIKTQNKIYDLLVNIPYFMIIKRLKYKKLKETHPSTKTLGGLKKILKNHNFLR